MAETALSDRAVSIIRTAVPILWGTVLARALAAWPWISTAAAWIGLDLASPVVSEAITALVIVAWYAAWRWAEPKLPTWLRTVALGSAAAPTYSAKAVGG